MKKFALFVDFSQFNPSYVLVIDSNEMFRKMSVFITVFFGCQAKLFTSLAASVFTFFVSAKDRRSACFFATHVNNA